MRHPRAAWAVLAVAAGVGLAILGGAPGQQVHRYGFEQRAPVWLKGSADAPFRETAHDITEDTAHSGQFSEHIHLTAEVGNFIHYYYPIGRGVVAEEFSASIWIKANRPGAQILGRLVLPQERNPHNHDEPLTTLLRGDSYQLVGRWQKVELNRTVKLSQQQQQLMRAELGRDVNFNEAFIDQLILNVYGGPGTTEIWIDDLEVGPVLDPEPRPRVISSPQPGGQPRAARTSIIELNQERLLVNGRRFFFRGIRHSDTPLKALRDAGFNTIWFDYATSPGLVQEAVNLGFWVVPALPVTSFDPQLVGSTDMLSRAVNGFLEGDAVLFWDLGGGLTAEQAPLVDRASRLVRGADPQRPLAADVWDGFLRYSRQVDLIGVHRWPLMTDMELTQYRQWLEQRRRLARPGTFMWTWVQTHLPEWYTRLVYERSGSATFDEPIGPQPEQIRLQTYAALAAGCRGLGFWSDRFLADSHQGRDRLLQMALLNQEIRLLEPLLTSVIEAPAWVDTSIEDIKAAVLRTERGILVLPMWLGKGGQFVPGQSAAVRLSIVVPQVPQACQAWEVSPADVRALIIERVPGGTKVTLPEFGLTGAIVLTSDLGPNGLLVRFQDQARRMRKMAAQWAHDLAEVELEKVLKIEEQLERAGHKLEDGQALKDDAQARLRTCVAHWNNGDYRQTYLEANRAMRPVRIMMRAQWDQAVKDLDSAVASPYAVSYFTLPRHWQFWDQIKDRAVKPNVLTDGGFELAPGEVPEAWTAQENTLDDVEMKAQRVSESPKEGRQCLVLKVKPKDPARTPVALERTFLAIHSPAVRLEPGTLVKVSGWMRIPKPIEASPDGALLYDSAGGEPLAIRISSLPKWNKFTLYRKVPASGTIHVTLALTGLGAAYFDDIRIEPIDPTQAAPPETREPSKTPVQATPTSGRRLPGFPWVNQ